MKLLRRTALLLLLLAALCCAAAAADATAEDLDALYKIMFENYEAQNKEFTVEYTGDPADLQDENGRVLSCAALTRQMAASTENPFGRGADIAMMNLNSGLAILNGNELRFRVTYLLDRDQLDFMDRKAGEIAESLNAENKGELLKIKAVYEYMTNNFYYDHTYQHYTDYDGITTGTMVCQGYALLTYRLLWKLGIPCRIVAGSSFGEPHGWNLVRLYGKWYSLDTTWDSRTEEAPMAWNYFLRSPVYFSNHTTDPAFLSDRFLGLHPQAEKDYDLPRVTVLVEDEAFASLILRNGRSIRLTTQTVPVTHRTIVWESSDPSVVSVDPDGTVHSLQPGAVTITATVKGAEEHYIAGTFPVTAVDTASCSPWAYEELNNYYLRSLYPAELCGSYQQAITREEFAQLIYQFLSKYATMGGSFHVPAFTDIEDSPYWMAIAFTSARHIFQGTGENTFSPTAPLTREQAAKVLCALADYMSMELPGLVQAAFADAAAVSPWAAEHVQRVADAGLFVGDDAGNFCPRQALTREQAAVLLERLVVQVVEPWLAEKTAA